MTASAAQGSVVLNGIDTTINTGTITAGQNIDLTTTGGGNINVEDEINALGYVRLDSAESLVLNHNITSDSFIELGASEGLTLNSNIEASNRCHNRYAGRNYSGIRQYNNLIRQC